MEQTREYHFTQQDIREWLFGIDAQSQMKLFLDSDQQEFDKEYLIRKLIESYTERMSQEIKRFQAAE